MYAKHCPHCQALNGPTAVTCGTCQQSLKGVPLTHGDSASPAPRVGRRWDLLAFTVLVGGLFSLIILTLCSLAGQPLLGVGLGLFVGVMASVVGTMAVTGPKKPLDESRDGGSVILFGVLFLLVMIVVLLPVVIIALIFSAF